MIKILYRIYFSSEHIVSFFYSVSTVNRPPSNEVMIYEDSKTNSQPVRQWENCATYWEGGAPFANYVQVKQVNTQLYILIG